eukprot:scaffold692_cov118-Cylindrotheca_fusiformis.AAC.13
MIASLPLRLIAMQPHDQVINESSTSFSKGSGTQMGDSSQERSKQNDNSSNAISAKKYFPSKLLQLLEDSTLEGNEHIVSWLPHGKAFKVHSPADFENKLIRRYFRQTKYRSFVRQLYHYRFARIDFGEDKGAYYHPDFQRHHRDRCMSIQRNAAEEVQADSEVGQRIPALKPNLAPITPAHEVSDFKIALGTDSSVSDIHASRELYNHLGSHMDTSKPGDGETDGKSVVHHPDKTVSFSSTFHPNYQNQMTAAQQQLQQQRTQDQNWLGAWLARQYSGNDNGYNHIDLEPRPIQDMNRKLG